MTAAWVAVYSENTSSSGLAFYFAGAEINLSPMAAGDTVEVRISKILSPTGSLVVHDQVTYAGAQPATHPSIHIGAIPNVYGIEIAMRQTVVAVALLTLELEAFDAKRIGLS
jgi:hypothetical protein